MIINKDHAYRRLIKIPVTNKSMITFLIDLFSGNRNLIMKRNTKDVSSLLGVTFYYLINQYIKVCFKKHCFFYFSRAQVEEYFGGFSCRCVSWGPGGRSASRPATVVQACEY